MSSENGCRRNRRRTSPPVFVSALLIVAVFLVNLSAVFAMPSYAQSAPMSSTSSGPQREIVAVLDSKGSIHAAWIDRDDPSAQGNTSLWYSTYDPEAPRSSTVRLIDRSTLIDSLDMTIDDADGTHIVWVRPTPDPGMSGDANMGVQARGVYYRRMLADGRMLFSPGPLLEPRADSVCVSVASGYGDEMYIAWIETRRVNSAYTESNTYYGSLRARGSTFDVTRTLVTTTTGGSSMLEAMISTDRSDLYLAWVDDLGEHRSRVMYTEVDLQQNVTATMSVEDLDGPVAKLAIAPTPDGDLVMGWMYYEPMLGERVLQLRKLSREGLAAPVALDVQPPQTADVESMTLDGQGNLHLVWIERSEEAQAKPRQVWVPRQQLVHTKLSSDGRSYEERREVPYGMVMGAFVLRDGEVYAVSQEMVLETARPLQTGSPVALVLALVLLSLVASGMGTEAGTYLVASWTDTASISTARLMKEGSAGLCANLLRRIGMRPGVTLSDLKRLSRRNTMDVAAHLRILESLGTIQSLREGTKQRFYRASPDVGSLPRVGELRESVIGLVEQVPGITEAQIARRLGVSQQLANYHLRLLAAAAILTRSRSAAKVGYVVNERVLARRRVRAAS